MLGRAVFVLLVLASALAADTPYWQEVSFRSVYPGASLGPLPSFPPSWERLPFRAAPQPQAMASLSPMRACVLSLTADTLGMATGDVYGAAFVKGDLMSNPLSPWRFVGRVMSAPLQRLVAVPFQSQVYAVSGGSGSNVFILSFVDGGGDVCGVLDVAKPFLAPGTVSFGDFITGVSLDADRGVLFIGSSAGAFAIHMTTGAVQTLSTDSVSALLYAADWRQLFFSTQLALYTYELKGQNGAYAETAHVWIGGNLDYAPIDMTFDVQGSNLWLVDNITAHRLNSAGVWDRFGYKQYAPINDISSVAVHNGVVYVGSASKGMSRLINSDIPIGKPAVNGDPWAWTYYGGARYLPNNNVTALFAEPDSVDSLDASVFAVTASGLALLKVRQWTLDQKAAVMQSFQEPRHDRYGLSSGCDLKQLGDLTQFVQTCDDNDGLWSSMSGMAAVYRAKETGDPDAYASAWKIFSGTERQNKLAGNFPHYPARSFAKATDTANGCNSPNDPAWYNATEPGWTVKGDTSSDELCGHLAFYPMMYDLAQTDQERARVLTVLEGVTGGMLANNYSLIDPRTGKPTTWGFFGPEALNNDPDHYSERGENSLSFCGWLASAYSITGDAKYKTAFWDLVNNHGYVENALNVKIDGSTDENHSDTELMFLAFHSLYYSYQRLPATHARKAELKAMVSLFDAGLERAYLLARDEHSPLWFGIYAGTAGKSQAHMADARAATWSLRHWAPDLINWQIDASIRQDTVIQPFYLRQSVDAELMRDIRPPSERVTSQWNNDPFAVHDGSGYTEFQPSVWTLPYWIMRHNQLIN